MVGGKNWGTVIVRSGLSKVCFLLGSGQCYTCLCVWIQWVLYGCVIYLLLPIGYFVMVFHICSVPKMDGNGGPIIIHFWKVFNITPKVD